mmetsp:Transcript_3754/g.5867  ORF Transcript_3754/g.5867 Transcript_3754/m.5867 type:complete len:294 (-) Transcript_3754:1815-2696(-)
MRFQVGITDTGTSHGRRLGFLVLFSTHRPTNTHVIYDQHRIGWSTDNVRNKTINVGTGIFWIQQQIYIDFDKIAFVVPFVGRITKGFKQKVTFDFSHQFTTAMIVTTPQHSSSTSTSISSSSIRRIGSIGSVQNWFRFARYQSYEWTPIAQYILGIALVLANRCTRGLVIHSYLGLDMPGTIRGDTGRIDPGSNSSVPTLSIKGFQSIIATTVATLFDPNIVAPSKPIGTVTTFGITIVGKVTFAIFGRTNARHGRLTRTFRGTFPFFQSFDIDIIDVQGRIEGTSAQINQDG